MRRYWIAPSARSGDVVEFSGEVFHHIFEVCRQTTGSHFEVLLGDGKAYLVEVRNVGKKAATATIKESREILPP
ncbi:MAG: 16S rRNA (uracil(1498)-N(3))-methyltransferase, partial [Bdellovibrionaceae bacterium]|nr:16S rRNA (uracil(1498)-N(3))-methyltransferase [Pseudobdellovibrionaceae bacterium]